MGNLKWIATPSTYRFADCEFGRYQVIGRGGRRLRVTDPVGCVLIHPEHRSIADAKAWAEADYARRVASLALANGYVKLADDEIIAKRLTSGEICFGTVNVDQIARKFGYVKLQPGTIQIKIEDAETLTEWFNDMVPPPWITQACERVRAALEVNP